MSNSNLPHSSHQQFVTGDTQFLGNGNHHTSVQGNDIKIINHISNTINHISSEKSKARHSSEKIIEQKIKRSQASLFVIRHKELDQVLGSLLNSQEESPSGKVTVLWGQGGCGKTTLALMCLSEKIMSEEIMKKYFRDEPIKKHFRGGIFWIDLGGQQNTLGAMKGLYKQITGYQSLAETVEDVAIEISHNISQEPTLIVLDNLQKEGELTDFLSCSSKYCSWLITTRNRSSFKDIDDINYALNCLRIDSMNIKESTLMLHQKLTVILHEKPREKIDEIEICNHERLHSILEKLVAQLYEFPLLIDLAYKKIKHRIDRYSQFDSIKNRLELDIVFNIVSKTLDDFQDLGWSLFSKELSSVFEESINFLSLEDRTALEELTIFQENTSIPISVLRKLWGLSKSRAREKCEFFYDLSLLQKYSLMRETVCVNSMLRQYLLKEGAVRERRSKIHTKLLEAYKSFYKTSFDSSTDLEAVFMNLPYENREEKKYMKGFYQYHFDESDY